MTEAPTLSRERLGLSVYHAVQPFSFTTEYDTLDYIDATFPGRIDSHFNVFVTLLYNALTQFTTSN